jgi:thiol-disulfide isomerase/thioredoxin
MNIAVKYYGASWCSPCKQAKPEVQRLCKNFGVQLHEYNYDDLEPAESEKITKLPTVQIWRDGIQIEEYITNQVSQLEEWLTLHVRVIPSDDF